MSQVQTNVLLIDHVGQRISARRYEDSTFRVHEVAAFTNRGLILVPIEAGQRDFHKAWMAWECDFGRNVRVDCG